MNKRSGILIVGHNDIMENSLYDHFRGRGYTRTHSSSRCRLDVLDQARVRWFFKKESIDYVFLGSVRSGGIAANQKRGAEFIYANLVSAVHVIEAAYRSGVKKLLFSGSSCVYPRACPQPMKAAHLLTGEMEKTSEPYSVAKLAGIKLCQAYRRQYGFNAIVAIPPTIYGPGMDMDPATSHVLGALIKKFHDAVRSDTEKVTLWGTGRPRREFVYVDDFVAASRFLMERYHGEEIIHAGCGGDVSIKDLAGTIARACGYQGKIVFDRTKPDGTMRKLLDSRRIRALGWRPKTDLKKGIERTCRWYAGLRRP